MKRDGRKTSKASANRVTGPGKTRSANVDDLRDHYDLDYTKAKPNRFASRLSKDSIVVVLEPDVADVFRSSKAVNAFLRSAIAAMPEANQPKKKRAS